MAKKTSKSRKKQQPKGNFLTDNDFLAEISAFLFLIISVFTILAFSSYLLGSIDRLPTFEQSVALQTNNLMGPVGHFTATILFGLFGVSSFVIPLLLIAYAFAVFKAEDPRDTYFYFRFSNLFTILVSFVALAALLSICFGFTGGGDLGTLLAAVLTKFINVTGALLLIAAIVLISVTQLTSYTIGNIIGMVAGYLRSGLHGVFVLLPQQIALLASVFFSSMFEGMFAERERVGDAGKVKKAKSKAPPVASESAPAKPFTFTGAKKSKAQSSEAVLDEDDQDPREVVVRRNQGLKKFKPKKSQQSFANYQPPSVDFLELPQESVSASEDDIVLLQQSNLIEEKLADFNIAGQVTEVHPGPVITMFEFEPAAGVKVNKIANLQDDLAMSLKASGIRIIAPIPGKGTVGIEVPNKIRDIVRLREVIESPAFYEPGAHLNIALGKDIYGDPVVVDIASMPHLLMAGATGAGKSVCINTLLLSMLYRCSPDELGLILIDPKILELSVYEGIPHLKAPVVTVPKQAKAVLEWAVKEMNHRYRLMQKYGVRSIDGFNRMVKGEEAEDPMARKDPEVTDLQEDQIIMQGTVSSDQTEDIDSSVEVDPLDVPVKELTTLPRIVIVIDEMADLMLSVGREIEDLIARLAQKARAAGIHLVLATQRPSVDVVTGLIKANFPARVAFRVSSRIDSRTILDSMGAERLLGKGDMLVMLPGEHDIKRVHGAFVSDAEVVSIIKELKNNSSPNYDAEIIDYCERAMEEENSKSSGDDGDMDYDELYDQTVQLVLEKGQASTSMLQRAFRIGYNRAARIVDTLEREGIVGPMDGSKPRKVLIQESDYE